MKKSNFQEKAMPIVRRSEITKQHFDKIVNAIQ